MKKIILFSLVVTFFNFTGKAQQPIRCATHQYYLNYIQQHPEYANKRALVNEQINSYLSTHHYNSKTEASVEIPVVVHVVYNTSAENISDAQINSEIDRINKDYNRQNFDTTSTPVAFKSVAGSLSIHFHLATTDPQNNPTNGIVRVHTNTTSFSDNDDVKYTSSGGDDAWTGNKYLNIWVCKLGGGLLGYTVPSWYGSPSVDGVVILYNAFGDNTEDVNNNFVLDNTYDLGRTATHEIGHWFNLLHTWGNSFCGNDFIADTPTAEQANYGCPSFPHTTSCSGQGANGEMFSNYMDYTDDDCMNIFTKDQVQRMWASIQLYHSNFVTGIKQISEKNKFSAAIYPNPSKGNVYLDLSGVQSQEISVSVFNILGKKIYQIENTIYKGRLNIDLSGNPSGIYFVQIQSQNGKMITKKISLTK